jgi:hypothetical protein
MKQRVPPIIDMAPDGSFVETRSPGARPPGRGWSFQVSGLAALAVFAAMTLALVAFFLWLLMWLVPITLGAGLIAYVAMRVKRWRLGKSGGPPSVFGVWNQHGKWGG